MRCVLFAVVLCCCRSTAIAASDERADPESSERTVVLSHPIPASLTEGVIPVFAWSLESVLKQGANTPAEALRQTPAYVGNTETENDSNGGTGSAFVNLFALGHENTLILINGRRTFTFKDINGLGLAALSRVEVLKGSGAAPFSGSGAVGGAVNFILLNGPGETPLEGAEINLLYGNTTDKDARVTQGWIRGGVATDKVAIAAAAEYYDRDAIFSRDREISASADRRPLGGANAGSPTYAGRVTFRTNPTLPASGRASVLIDPSENNPSGAADYRAYGGPNSDDPFNFRSMTPAIPAMEKSQYYITGRYKVFGEGLQIYGDLLYAKRKQENALAPAPFVLTNPQANRSPYNPFLGGSDDRVTGPLTSTGTGNNQLTSLSYRSIREGGLRKSLFDYDYWRYVAGINGNFNFTDNNFISFLGYDTGVVYERGDYLRINSGDARRTPLVAEIAAGNFNPFIGINAPLSGTAVTYREGVPAGTDTYDNVAAFQRASYVGRSFLYSHDFLADAKMFGHLFPNLFQGGIGFNLGSEYRHSRQKQIADPTQASGDQLALGGVRPFSYHQEVNAYFAEVQLPLVGMTMNIPLVHSLEFSAAYRYEDFRNKDQYGAVEAPTGLPLGKRTSQFDNNGDLRVALRYQPTRDLMFRASYQRSSRAPTLWELFEPVASAFPAPDSPTISEFLVGGNPEVRPEITDGYSAGFVFNPDWIAGLIVTADFYQLFTRDIVLRSSDLTKTIAAYPELFPDRIFFDSAPFFPRYIYADATNGNFGKRLVNGIDTVASYELPTSSFGTFKVGLGYNYFFTWKTEPVARSGSHSFLGDYNNSTLPLAPGAIPYHKGFVRGEWAWRGFELVATTNYISSYHDDPAFVIEQEGVAVTRTGGTDLDPQYNVYRRVSDHITLDLQASYEFVQPEMEAAAAGYSKDTRGAKPMQVHAAVAGVKQGSFLHRMLWGTKIRVGVVNAFDRSPPTVLGAFNDNYDTSLYSIRNRYYYVGITKRF